MTWGPMQPHRLHRLKGGPASTSCDQNNLVIAKLWKFWISIFIFCVATNQHDLQHTKNKVTISRKKQVINDYASAFSETIKAANTVISQWNFINMSKYNCRNVRNIFCHAFLAFGSISKHFQHANCCPIPEIQVPSKWTNSKVPCF